MEYWERDEVVREFAARAPDHRLLELIERYADPRAVRVLDIGCAAGRNTVLLAERGFDVHALDASAAMVAETRRRLGPILGEREAAARVQCRRMSDLERYPSASFDLAVALGVLHAAASGREWHRSAAGIARVLRPAGMLLVAAFTPDTDLTGEGLRPVAGEAHVFEGLPGGRATLLYPDELDAALGEHGFTTELLTSTGTTITERGRRVSANGLYRSGTAQRPT
ncbi:MAG TPA: class I SAM-dependent methyltransferase [Longimicrobiales bacterium]|nr:class I SAM-dependent methyltransferase [Longimicrobiales bacterium]